MNTNIYFWPPSGDRAKFAYCVAFHIATVLETHVNTRASQGNKSIFKKKKKLQFAETHWNLKRKLRSKHYTLNACNCVFSLAVCNAVRSSKYPSLYSVAQKWPVTRRNMLTFSLLMWRIWWAPNNASKWQMGFNSAFKVLNNSDFCATRCIAVKYRCDGLILSQKMQSD